MAVNKVICYETVLFDLSNDTVTAETLLSGIVAHGADGEVIVGTMEPAPSVLSGTTVPTANLGTNGDTYLKLI